MDFAPTPSYASLSVAGPHAQIFVITPLSLGVAIGGTRDASTCSKLSGKVLPEVTIFKDFFQNICQNFQISKYISKIKWAKSEEKSEFRVGGFDSPESAPHPHPQSKLRGDAPAPEPYQSCS